MGAVRRVGAEYRDRDIARPDEKGRGKPKGPDMPRHAPTRPDTPRHELCIGRLERAIGRHLYATLIRTLTNVDTRGQAWTGVDTLGHA